MLFSVLMRQPCGCELSNFTQIQMVILSGNGTCFSFLKTIHLSSKRLLQFSEVNSGVKKPLGGSLLSRRDLDD